jgi:Helix-turn-helix domain
MAEAPLMGRLDFYAAMVRSNAFTRSALTVAFILLYRCQNGRTGRCNPSIAVLAQETGLPERSVTRALRELRDSKWWLIRRGGEKGRGDTNNYAPQLERVSPVTPIRLEKGDKVGTKRVSPMTPKPVKNQERLSRSISSTTPGLHNGAVEQFEHFWQVYPSRGRCLSSHSGDRATLRSCGRSSATGRGLFGPYGCGSTSGKGACGAAGPAPRRSGPGRSDTIRTP